MRLTACPPLTFAVPIPIPPIDYNQYLPKPPACDPAFCLDDVTCKTCET